MRRVALYIAMTAVGAALCSVPKAQAQVFTDAGHGLVDYSKSELAPSRSCDAIGRYKSHEIVALRAVEVAADSKTSTPAFCRVTGTLSPEIAFEVGLPDHWNGRFYMIGNGGHAGESLEDPGRVSQRNRALQLGFAFAQTNTGHDTHKEPGASFVMSNPHKAIDYAYRAVHLTTVTAKAITARYYAKAPTRSYWNSCSNGGRQGLIEAQRYPLDYDGVVANAPWVSQTGFTIGAMWNQKAVTAAPLTPAKLTLLAEKVIARCDAIDGVRDGLIDDPRKCDFDARRDIPACPAGSDGDNCLSRAQADAVMKIYQGPSANGKPLFPGYMPGSEALIAARPAPDGGDAPLPASAWMNMIVPSQPGGKSADFNLAENTMRYLVHVPPQPDYDYTTFDFDHDAHMLDAWSRKVDANNPDLSHFRKHGGKLLMTYGWADQVLQPMMGVSYYEAAVARNGPRTDEFFRLFMVPGMTHCSGGNGTDRFDPMTALVDWVERNQPPQVLHAAHVVDNKAVRTRPLCPYPQVARYSGSGSIDDEASFHCTTSP
jgi:hypothetical protein